MKKFTITCDFGGTQAPFSIYIGDPHPEHHPLHFQAEWLASNRGGTIPGDVMDSVERLYKLSKKNKVSFEELCVYALGSDEDKERSGGAEAPPAPDEPDMPEEPPAP